MRLLVTGGAGFIGSNFIHYILKKYPNYFVVNYDKLTYAGHLSSLSNAEMNPNYKFIKGDIADRDRLDSVIKKNKITHIVNFAAETHVDRSIANSQDFIVTNVLGTQSLLDAALKNNIERFHHVSTDEVFGELELNSKDKFTEDTPYNPKSPYSASKAASDHLVRAYAKTHGLFATITNASNNFGPYCDSEKFIPRAITNLIDGKKIPIYGDGKYVRDWLYVEDHCKAIDLALHFGKKGETYLVGGGNYTVSNLDVARMILDLFGRGDSFIEFVTDRPAHDRRYAVDFSKIKKELGWEPSGDLKEKLRKTVEWYRNNESWWKPLKEESEKFYKELEETRLADKFTQYIKETSIPGLLSIEMPTFADDRGFFRENVRLNALEKAGNFKFSLKQWNHANSKPGVVRALHAENWNKIVYPATGEMFAALVDIRPDSPTFGKVETFNFDEKNHRALFIPKGVANSICVNGNKTVEYFYLVDAYYDGKDTTAVTWDDPDLAIKWPVKNPLVSERDRNNPTLRELFPEKFTTERKVLVLGAGGLVGSRFVELHKNKSELLIPSSEELDITSRDSVEKYLSAYRPDIIVNFAAYTNVGEGENQRGDKKGGSWQINVEGIKNMIDLMDGKTRFIHISTDMVFPGSKDDKGPYKEDKRFLDNSKKLTWYGYTKGIGEKIILDSIPEKSAILRIIYPFSFSYDKKLDYVRKPLSLYDEGKLYPMFSDQQVSTTLTDSVAKAVEKLIETGKTGVFHASSKNTTTPQKLVNYLLSKTRGVKNAAKGITVDEFVKKFGNPIRYPKFGGLSVEKTEKELGIKFGTWESMVDEFAKQSKKN